jgi:DNA-binding NarL/FixJ family response regulator
MKNGKISLALVDDHQIVIDGLMSLLKGHDKFRFAFATTNPEEVIRKMGETPVDILLTDVMMPHLPGNALAKQVREKFPDVRILALSMSGQGDRCRYFRLCIKKHRETGIDQSARKNCGRRDLFQ